MSASPTFSGDNFAAYSDRVTPIVPAILSGPPVNPAIPATTNGEINTSASIAPGVNFSLNTLVLRPSLPNEMLTLGAASVLNTSAILLPRYTGYGYTIESGSPDGRRHDDEPV